MKVLIIDTGSNALDFAMRCQAWGHEVVWYDRPRTNGTERRAGEGLVTKLRDFDLLRTRYLGWADLIYTPDNSTYLHFLEPYRKLGYPIYGCNVEAAKLEDDRAAGQAALKEAGIKIIEGKEFHDHDSAIAYVRRTGKAYVSKPSGPVDEREKALSYVADSPADLIYMLERWKAVDKYRSMARESGFVLQEKKSGCEIAAGGWFGPGGWCDTWCINFEHKKLMAGGLGPNTGEMGTMVMLVSGDKLVDQWLKPLTKILRRLEYVGYVDVNGCVDDRGQPWPFELTMRDGWPLKHNHMALQKGDPAKWMLDLVEGRDTMIPLLNTVSISVLVAIPDFPFSRLTGKDVEGIPIYGATDKEHIHLSEVMVEDVPVMAGGKVVTMPCYVTAGDYVLVVTGEGETVRSARKSVYSAVRKVKIPNSPFYRTDIGAGSTIENLLKVQKHGYAKKFTV